MTHNRKHVQRLRRQNIALCLLLVAPTFPSRAETDRFAGISTVKTRSLGLGGAFTAVADPLAAWEFNPAGAGFVMPEQKKTFDFTLYFNAVGPALLLKNKDYFNDGFFFLGTLLKGFHAKAGPFTLGGVFGEELLLDDNYLKRPCILDLPGHLNNRNSTLGIALGLGGRVSIGFSTEIFKRQGTHRSIYEIGYRYGVQVKTRSRIDIGLFYSDFPAKYKSDRLPVERLGDETLNMGLAFHPAQWMTLSADIRNVSDENKPAVREPHAGLELRPVSFLSLRAGYFQEKNGTDWISGGLGLGYLQNRNMNSFWKHIRIEGTFMAEKTAVQTNLWWFATTLLVW